MVETPTCCLCPLSGVDWTKDGGLLNFNLPCMCGDMNALLYQVIDTPQGEVIIIDQGGLIIPSWLLLIPCTAFALCCIYPCSYSQAWVISKFENHYRLQFKVKNICGEQVHFTRKMISSVELEEKTTFLFKQHRFSIASSSGMPPDKSIWMPNYGSLADKYRSAVDEINCRIILTNHQGEQTQPPNAGGGYVSPTNMYSASPCIVGPTSFVQSNIMLSAIPMTNNIHDVNHVMITGTNTAHSNTNNTMVSQYPQQTVTYPYALNLSQPVSGANQQFYQNFNNPSPPPNPAQFQQDY